MSKLTSHGAVAGRLDNDHHHSGCAPLRADLNAEPDAWDDSEDFMTLRITYATSPENLQAGNLQSIRF